MLYMLYYSLLIKHTKVVFLFVSILFFVKKNDKSLKNLFFLF